MHLMHGGHKPLNTLKSLSLPPSHPNNILFMAKHRTVFPSDLSLAFHTESRKSDLFFRGEYKSGGCFGIEGNYVTFIKVTLGGLGKWDRPALLGDSP